MVKLFRALISALLLTAEGARVSLETELEVEQVWNFNGLQVGPNVPLGPLLPGLVPPPGTTFEVVNREMELGVGSASNEYRWAFLNIDQGGQRIPVNEWFASISGEHFFGVYSGTRRTVVRNNLGFELFVIEAARRSTVTSWRIRHPISNQILFTINKDFFGAGFFGARDEWRIYRGRERDGDQMYYVVADYSSHTHSFYHNEAEYQNSAPPAAQSRQYTPGGTYTQGFVSDSIGVQVQAGEDTALVLATTICVDMLNEVRAAQQRAQAARRREEQITGHRRRRRSAQVHVHVNADSRRRDETRRRRSNNDGGSRRRGNNGGGSRRRGMGMSGMADRRRRSGGP